MNNMNIPKKVAVIGLGFVGLTLGLHLTRCGFKVLGVEKNPATLKALNESKPTFFEPGIEQVLSSAISNGDMEIYDSEIPQADYFIITVGTPIDDDHNLITAPLISASKQIAVSLKDGDTVIVRST
ncbi:hypothetical protein OAI34_05585, partial [Emcibacteraceae bacterium]|nr:hypothetical protein [Emcibacteraceae bacterium]